MFVLYVCTFYFLLYTFYFLSHFEPCACYEFLCQQKMNNKQVSSFLTLLNNDSTNLGSVSILPFIKQDIESNGTKFGTRPIHFRLIARDCELLGLNSKPLCSDQSFLQVWASKLCKVTDINLKYDTVLRNKYLVKLKAWMDKFVVKGSAASLQNLILFHILTENEKQGKFDKEIIRQYLEVPKLRFYNKSVLKSKKWKKSALADYTYSIPGVEFLPAIIDDTDVILRCFRHLFTKKEEQAKKWSDVVDTDFLKTILCETRIMNGGEKNADLKKMYSKVQGKYAMNNLRSFVHFYLFIVLGDSVSCTSQNVW